MGIWCLTPMDLYQPKEPEQLMRCACGAEKVIQVGPIIVRHRSTN